MYLIINHFAFEYPKSNMQDTDIIDAFNNLGNLFIELKKINIDLITHSTLSQVSLNAKPIRTYLQSIEDNNIRKAIITLIGKIRPICSDTDIAFENKENIAFGNCLEEIEKIDVCYTFLSCALFYLDPILTINNLCSKEQFLKDNIKIICDNESYTLDNYRLIPYTNVIDKIKEYQTNKLLDKHNLIDNWDDYQIFVNTYFDYCKITNYCLETLSKKFAYGNSYSVQVRNKIQRMNDLIKQANGCITTMDFSSLGLGTPESSTRQIDLKKSHVGIKDYDDNVVHLNWHDYIQKDFRIYFEKNTAYVSFVHFEKKIG
jgi:hypothetical protein